MASLLLLAATLSYWGVVASLFLATTLQWHRVDCPTSPLPQVSVLSLLSCPKLLSTSVLLRSLSCLEFTLTCRPRLPFPAAAAVPVGRLRIPGGRLTRRLRHDLALSPSLRGSLPAPLLPVPVLLPLPLPVPPVPSAPPLQLRPRDVPTFVVATLLAAWTFSVSVGWARAAALSPFTWATAAYLGASLSLAA